MVLTTGSASRISPLDLARQPQFPAALARPGFSTDAGLCPERP